MKQTSKDLFPHGCNAVHADDVRQEIAHKAGSAYYFLAGVFSGIVLALAVIAGVAR